MQKHHLEKQNPINFQLPLLNANLLKALFCWGIMHAVVTLNKLLCPFVFIPPPNH